MTRNSLILGLLKLIATPAPARPRVGVACCCGCGTGGAAASRSAQLSDFSLAHSSRSLTHSSQLAVDDCSEDGEEAAAFPPELDAAAPSTKLISSSRHSSSTCSRSVPRSNSASLAACTAALPLRLASTSSLALIASMASASVSCPPRPSISTTSRRSAPGPARLCESYYIVHVHTVGISTECM